jgi:long-subunit acyl-CoA synthetase (AMP-forming)
MANTIRELLLESVHAHPNGVALRHKQNGEWLTVSYEALLLQSRCVSEVIHALGQPHGQRIAMFLDNERR